MTDKPLKMCQSCGREFLVIEDFLIKTSRWRMCNRGHLWFNCSCHSTNMILKGKFSWYSPEMFLSLQGRSVFNLIPALKQLPQIPTYVMELQQRIQDENTTSHQLAEDARKAPVLASQILEIANGRLSTNHRIESLDHAITYVGRQVLKDVISVAGLMSFRIETKIFNLSTFWEESFLTGRIADRLVKMFSLPIVPDEAYIAGTLCNIGKLVLALYDPVTADLISYEVGHLTTAGAWQKLEIQNGIPEHPILGEIGACFWGLPEYVIDSITEHHKHINSKSNQKLSLFEIVALANQLRHLLEGRPHHVDQMQLDALFDRFKINKKSPETFVQTISDIKVAS